MLRDVQLWECWEKERCVDHVHHLPVGPQDLEARILFSPAARDIAP